MAVQCGTMPVRERADDWDETTDVVVVGSGFSGLAAAIEARNHGAAVVILEKLPTPGGNSIISDGGIAAPGTALQQRSGIADSAERLYDDMLKAGLGMNHPELARTLAEGASEAFEWSCDYLGVEYLDRIDIFGGHSVPRCYTPRGRTGAAMIRRLLDKAAELGLRVSCRAFMQRLVQDPEGRVCGVLVRDDPGGKAPDRGGVRAIKARQGVVLAAGGFASDIAFRMVQDPRLTASIDSSSRPSATAETLVEALRIGAAPVQLSHIQLGPWGSPDEKGYREGARFADYILFQHGILLDPGTASRFCNEMGDRKTVADAMLALGHPCIGLVDAGAVSQSGWSVDRCLRQGVVKSFATLPEFAAAYGLQPACLALAVQGFNDCFQLGRDPAFGRPLIPAVGPIVTPPFHGMRLWPKVHYTMGGIRIDSRAAVLDLAGRAIPGLYAAGEVTGGVHGACRLGSCSIPECLVFGRIAGQNAAAAMDRHA